MLGAQGTAPIRAQGLSRWLDWALGWCLCGETEWGGGQGIGAIMAASYMILSLCLREGEKSM